MTEFIVPITKAVEVAMKLLLSEKHLYQYVELDLTFIPAMAEKIIKQKGDSIRPPTSFGGRGPVSLTTAMIASSARQVSEYLWMPYINIGQEKTQVIPVVGNVASQIQFQMPTINTFCKECEDRWPFNPVFEGAICVIDVGQSQRYFFGYQCQQCKKFPIRFMVRREGLKLRLVGRDPLEALPTPKVLPKAAAKFYGDSQIAHHAGQTLAAIFLLRTFIEQYWQSVPAVQAVIQQQARATGDEQGTAYQGTLPVDFKSRFPSLSEVYGKLSAAMHQANADGVLFEEACGAIIKHFDARRLFNL